MKLGTAKDLVVSARKGFMKKVHKSPTGFSDSHLLSWTSNDMIKVT